jgi:hypothetical protein
LLCDVHQHSTSPAQPEAGDAYAVVRSKDPRVRHSGHRGRPDESTPIGIHACYRTPFAMNPLS